jgi:hypothetical protein
LEHPFGRIFVTNGSAVDVTGLVVGAERALFVLHVVGQKSVQRMPFRYSGFDRGFATGRVHAEPRETIFDLPMSDGRQSQGSRVFFFYEATNCHMVTSTLWRE